MTTFLNLHLHDDREFALEAMVASIRDGEESPDIFDRTVDDFAKIPGSPFAYWAPDAVYDAFTRLRKFEQEDRFASVGASTKNDFRFVRLWTEVPHNQLSSSRAETAAKKWVHFAKGGRYSPFYRDIKFVINWLDDGSELKAAIAEYRGSRGWGYQWSAALNGHDYYFRPGLSWPLRGRSFSPQVMPKGCIFSGRSYAAFMRDADLLPNLAILNSRCFDFIIKSALGRFGHPEFLVGIVHKMPFVESTEDTKDRLRNISLEYWSLSRSTDETDETTHTFMLPKHMHKGGPLDASTRKDILKAEIDRIAFELFGFDASAQSRMIAWLENAQGTEQESPELITESGEQEQEDSEPELDDDDEEDAPPIGDDYALLSWCVGVAFGRFDIGLATGERQLPSPPDPFEPLPAMSPGMRPVDCQPFHANSGILVDDPGHEHDLPHVVEAVLERVHAPVPADVRKWMRREFFPGHLKQYSQSGRKAPIYWPLSTPSGNYTLWIYYPELSNQTLFVAVSDFIEPKLEHVDRSIRALRVKPGRSRDDDRELEQLEVLEEELRALRSELLRIAPGYKPNHDDGVQITAAPLWPLFRFAPWQKLLRDTWRKLEAEEYEWAHLAMTYWPTRVAAKCQSDKSLAIAHRLLHLYQEPPVAEIIVKEKRSRKAKG